MFYNDQSDISYNNLDVIFTNFQYKYNTITKEKMFYKGKKNLFNKNNYKL